MSSRRPFARRAPEARRAGLGGGARSIAWIAFGLFFLQSAIWSIAVPLGSGQDEPAQTITAAADVRGQLIKPHATAYADIVGMYEVRVPGTYTNGFLQIGLGLDPACGDPGYGSACHPSVTNPVVLDTWTYTGDYPPLYYLAVGWPSLITSSLVGIYLMRLLSALLCSGVLALAVLALARTSRRPLVPAAAAIAISPMVLYTAATVQPSGLEISSAALLFAAGSAIAFGPDDPPRGSLAISDARRGVAHPGAAGIARLHARDSPCARPHRISLGATRVVARPRPTPLARSARRSGCPRHPLVRRCGPARRAVARSEYLGVSGINAHPRRHPHALANRRLRIAVDRDLRLAVIPAPRVTEAIWIIGFVALVVGAARAREHRRSMTGAALLTLVAIAVPPAFVASSVIEGTSLLLFQGRYVLPLALGLPLLLGTSIDRLGPRVRGAVVALCVLCAFGQLDCFYSVLRVYTVGDSGPLDLLGGGPSEWHPPVSAPLLVASFAVAAVGYAWLLFAWLQTSASHLEAAEVSS